MELSKYFSKPLPKLPTSDLISDTPDAEQFRFYGEHPSLPLSKEKSSYLLVEENSMLFKLNSKNRFCHAVAKYRLIQDDIYLLTTPKRKFTGYKVKKEQYFGSLLNLEENTIHNGNFDDHGKLQGFGNIDNNLLGEFQNGWLDGYCHIVTESQDKIVEEIYCGNSKSGVLSGFGVLVKQNLRYFGNFKNENMAGYGVLEFWSGPGSSKLRALEYENTVWGESDVKANKSYTIYKGEFRKDKKHGIGYLHDYELKEKYIGEFKTDTIEGFGRLKTRDYIYIGDFKKGFQHGFGLKESSKQIYVGFFSKGRKHGQGMILDAKGNKEIISEWQDGKIHGKAVFYKGKTKGVFAEYKDGSVSKELNWDNRKEFLDTVDNKINFRRAKGSLSSKIKEFEAFVKKGDKDIKFSISRVAKEKIALRNKSALLNKKISKLSKQAEALQSKIASDMDMLTEELQANHNLELSSVIDEYDQGFLRANTSSFPASLIANQRRKKKESSQDDKIKIDDGESVNSFKLDGSEDKDSLYGSDNNSNRSGKENSFYGSDNDSDNSFIDFDKETQDLENLPDIQEESSQGSLLNQSMEEEKKYSEEEVEEEKPTVGKSRKSPKKRSKPKLKPKDGPSKTRNKEKLRKQKPSRNGKRKPPKPKANIQDNSEALLEDDEVKPMIFEDADISLLLLSKSNPISKEYFTPSFEKDQEYIETMNLFKEEASSDTMASQFFNQFTKSSSQKLALPKFARIKKTNHPLVLKNNNQFEKQSKILENIFDQWDAEGDSDED